MRAFIFSLFSLCICLGLSSCTEVSEVKEEAKQVPLKREEIMFSYAPVVKKVAPAVVNIFAFHHAKTGIVNSPFMEDPFFKQFFEYLHPGEDRDQSSLGSGVLISKDGLILTNYHVIQNADVIRVVLSNKQEYVAKLIVMDKKTDLAVLKIEGKSDFPFLTVTAQENLEVGDVVLAIGNPFGVGQTVTTGIISALARSQEGINDYRSFIQTDAAINPGNSGGPLVTTDGTLVGINTAIYSKTGGSMGISFAIPTSLAIPVIKSAESGGNVLRPWMGLEVIPVDNKIAHALGLPHPYGAFVKSVYPGGPADEAGIKAGDFIAAFDGKKIEDDAALDYQIAISPVGKTSEFTIVRKGKEKKIAITLKAPLEEKTSEALLIQGQNPLRGASLQNISPALALEFGLDPMERSVIVTNVVTKEPAAQLGIRPGDILESVNDKKITSKEQVVAILEKPASSWVFKLRRGDQILDLQVATQ
ncbi:MAG: Do family serine endopeptidase [Proteobacteria bacterium]|nr:Do family serine endopeptidase [Pseudomonadota bacterium]